MKSLSFPTPPQRILIIKPSAIGDIVHALPVLNLLRGKWPAAHVSWLVSSACASLLEGHPQIDELIRFERRRFGKGWRKPSAALGLFSFTRGLREKNFDLVIDLQGLFRSGWLAWKTRAPIRVGPNEARELGWVFYTHHVATGFPEGHAVDRYLKIADALGLGREPVKFVFATTDSDRQSAAELIEPGRRFAILLPGANWKSKRWPVEHFAALVKPLHDQFALESSVVGAAGDKELAAQIPGAVDLTGRTNLRQLVALMERAEIVIGNDTGPLHIAAALGRPLVALYGPTNPDYTGPYGRLDSVLRHPIECSPCLSSRCRYAHLRCLAELNPQSVLKEVRRQLSPAADHVSMETVCNPPHKPLPVLPIR
jgi:heptosyltransferase-1